MARDWVNEVREAMQVPKLPGIFTLGVFERRVRRLAPAPLPPPRSPPHENHLRDASRDDT